MVASQLSLVWWDAAVQCGTLEIGKSIASELEKVIRVIAVLVDQRGNDSAGVRHPLDLRTSLQLVLDLFSAL